jgi:hypothetical protein
MNGFFCLHKVTYLENNGPKVAINGIEEEEEAFLSFTTGVNFTNILRAAFELVGLRQ